MKPNKIFLSIWLLIPLLMLSPIAWGAPTDQSATPSANASDNQTTKATDDQARFTLKISGKTYRLAHMNYSFNLPEDKTSQKTLPLIFVSLTLADPFDATWYQWFANPSQGMDGEIMDPKNQQSFSFKQAYLLNAIETLNASEPQPRCMVQLQCPQLVIGGKLIQGDPPPPNQDPIP